MTKRQQRKRSRQGRPKGYVTSEETKQKQRLAQLAIHAEKRELRAAQTVASLTAQYPNMTIGTSDPTDGSTSIITDSYDGSSTTVRQVIAARKSAAREIKIKENPRTALSTFNDVNYKQFINLTLQKIRTILNSSQSSAGDLESSSEYADTMYLEDAHLRSVLDSHVSSVVGKPLLIDDPQSDNPDDKRAVELIRLCLNNVKNLQGTLRALTFAQWVGQAFAEIQWASVSITGPNSREMVIRKPYKLQPVHSKKWRIQLVPTNDSNPGEGEFKYTLWDRGRFYNHKGPGFIGVDVDKDFPNTFIKHSPETNIPIHKRGLWRGVAFKFFQKKAMEQFMDAGAERYAWPFVYAVGPQDMSDESMDSVLDGLDSISQNVNAVFEQGTEIHSLSISSPQGAADLFNSRIEQIDKAYSKLILGSTLVVEEGDSGSRALGETQNQSKVDRASLEASQLCETLREQLFRPILEVNAHLFESGAPNIPTCRFSLAEDTQEPITQDLYPFFTINEIRESKGYAPVDGPEGDRFAGAPPIDSSPTNDIKE